MKLLFKTIKDKEANNYILEYDKEDDRLNFSLDDTTYNFILNDNNIICLRSGKLKQVMEFIPNKVTKTILKDEFGLEIEFLIYTDLINISDKGIYLKYKLFAEKDLLSEHKIWIKYLANESEIV